jgi:hypothetical protein
MNSHGRFKKKILKILHINEVNFFLVIFNLTIQIVCLIYAFKYAFTGNKYMAIHNLIFSFCGYILYNIFIDIKKRKLR